MMKKCLIISGGQCEKIKIKDKYDLIIACDKGYLNARKLKIKPDVIVGDFDSAKKPNHFDNVLSVSPIKDDTDTGLAIKYALKNGYRDIDIVCALGGRIDHMFANISFMKYIVEHSGAAKILSNDAMLIVHGKGKVKIQKENSKYLSIFSLSDKSKIDYIKGTKYDVKNIVLRNGFPLGVSNEIKNRFAEISVASGMVLIINIVK